MLDQTASAQFLLSDSSHLFGVPTVGWQRPRKSFGGLGSNLFEFSSSEQVEDIRFAVSSLADSFEEKLFVSLSQIKIKASQFAMHIDRDWRNILFNHLDSMYEPADWQSGDKLLSVPSFEGFLRFWVLFRPQKNPSLGIAESGLFYVSFEDGRDSIGFEFSDRERLRWHLRQSIAGKTETASGQSYLIRLNDVLSPYPASRLLYDQVAGASS